MKLTAEQRSEIISEMASSEAGFNELMRVLLDSFSKQERALFLEEHKGEQGNGFRPRRWRGHGCSFQLRIPRTRSGAFQPIILGVLAAQESERALLFHELYARGLSCEDIAEVGRRIYGHHYSKQQVSRLSGACYEEIKSGLRADFLLIIWPSTSMPRSAACVATGASRRRPTTRCWDCCPTAVARCSRW